LHGTRVQRGCEMKVLCRALVQRGTCATHGVVQGSTCAMHDAALHGGSCALHGAACCIRTCNNTLVQHVAPCNAHSFALRALHGGPLCTAAPVQCTLEDFCSVQWCAMQQLLHGSPRARHGVGVCNAPPCATSPRATPCGHRELRVGVQEVDVEGSPDPRATASPCATNGGSSATVASCNDGPCATPDLVRRGSSCNT